MEQHREIDMWLRRMAIMGPIIAFMVGWGSGVITAAMLYRDHEKRISFLEVHSEKCNEMIAQIHQWMARMDTIHVRENR